MTTNPRRARTPSAPMDPRKEALLLERRLAKEARNKKQIVVGLASLAGIGLMVAIGFWMHANEVAQQEAVHEAHLAQVKTLRDAIPAAFAEDAAQARKALASLTARRQEWQQWKESSDFSAIEAKATATIAADDAAHAATTLLANAEANLNKTPMDPASLKSVLQDIGKELPNKLCPPAQHAQLQAMNHRVVQGLCEALRQASTTEKDAAASLGLLAEAADVASDALAASHGDAAATATWSHTSSELRKQVNQQAMTTFDATAIAARPWQDLLPGTTTASWSHSNASDLSAQVDKGELSVRGPAANQAQRGAIVLHEPPWRACEIECDVELNQGAASLLLRMGKVADPKICATVNLGPTAGKDTIVVAPGKSVHLDAVLLGDHLVVKSDGEPAHLDLALTTAVHSGGFGIVTAPGTQMTVRHLRVKRLF